MALNLRLLFVLFVFCRSPLVSLASQDTVTTQDMASDDPSVDHCLNELAQTYGDAYDWSSVSPPLLISLALNYNRTGSCRLDDLSPDEYGNAGSLASAQQKLPNEPHAGSTRTVKREDNDAISQDLKPTPAPTGSSSPGTTVHIANEHDFALLLPGRKGELISDAEADGVAFCTPESGDSSCTDSARMREGFIAAAALAHAEDGSWIQVTGCLNVAQSQLDPSDAGGQFDVRFPNGAQCTFGGYGASFIELVEPALNRFCLRCCVSANDQVNCNSHHDRDGCDTAIPGTYDFPELGVSCS